MQWRGLMSGSDGKFHQERLGGQVIHELIHAVYEYEDLLDPIFGTALGDGDKVDYNNANFDFLGQTVKLQNQIFRNGITRKGTSKLGTMRGTTSRQAYLAKIYPIHGIP